LVKFFDLTTAKKSLLAEYTDFEGKIQRPTYSLAKGLFALLLLENFMKRTCVSIASPRGEEREDAIREKTYS
jgi:hypothetical protein